jgi:hypothetical protein
VERKSVIRDADGIRRTLMTDSDDPTRFHVITEQNIDEVLASIQRDAENHRERSTNKLLARIPITVYETAVHEGWDEGDWKRYLNSSEAAPFRIWKGSI